MSLCFGTISVTALASYLVSPGVCRPHRFLRGVGLGNAAGAAPFGRVPNGVRPLALGAVGLFAGEFATGVAWRSPDADKEHYRQLAVAAGELDELGYPLVAVERLTSAHCRFDRTGAHGHFHLRARHQVEAILLFCFHRFFWDIATNYPWEAAGMAELQARNSPSRGFVLVQSEPFQPVMSLDLWVSADLVGDQQLDLLGQPNRAPVEDAPGWWLEDGGVRGGWPDRRPSC
ncbi:MAG: hypothetical protein R2855_13550 [Thermomicrobiales bacterium]